MNNYLAEIEALKAMIEFQKVAYDAGLITKETFTVKMKHIALDLEYIYDKAKRGV